MAFSINSVGHLVKSFQVGSALKEVWEKVGLTDDAELANFKMHSLGGALVAAMQTINGAFPATSGADLSALTHTGLGNIIYHR